MAAGSSGATFPPSSKSLFEDRLFQVYSSLEDLIVSDNIQLIAYEAPVGVRGENGYKLAQVVGIVNLLGVKHQIKLIPYSPTIIKKTVTGDGRATKKDIEVAVRGLYPIREARLLDDTLDANAILHCHLVSSQSQPKVLVE